MAPPKASLPTLLLRIRSLKDPPPHGDQVHFPLIPGWRVPVPPTCRIIQEATHILPREPGHPALQSLCPPVTTPSSHYTLQSVTMLCSHYALWSLCPPVTTLSGHYEPAPQPYEPVPQPCGYTLPCVHPQVAPRVDVQGPPSRDPSVRGFLCPVLGTPWPSGSIVSLTKGCRDREPASCPHAACRGEACVVSARTKP